MLDSFEQYLADRFGGKRAALRLLRYQAEYILGRYGRYHDARLTETRRMIFVCAGNICRSPFAHHLALSFGLPAISYGFQAGEDSPANDAAASMAKEFGISLADHRSAPIRLYKAEPGDLLLCFEPKHARALDEIVENTPNVDVNLVGMWHTPRWPYIHDPYNLSPVHFRGCFRRIYESVSALRGRYIAERLDAAK